MLKDFQKAGNKEKINAIHQLTNVEPVNARLDGHKFESVLTLPNNLDRVYEGGLRTRGKFKRRFKGRPLFTVITVVLNRKDYLEETIMSVLSQTYDNVEYIIIDGGSTDGSLDIIKKYEKCIDYCVSEPDRGIYHAMNKGIILAQGEIIAILNSDDTFKTFSLEKVVQIASGIKQNDFLIHGKIAIYNSKQTYIGERYPKKIPGYYLFSTPFKHPAMFVSKDLYQKVGLYDEDCGLASDYDMMLRIKKSGSKNIFIDTVLTNVNLVGISTSKQRNASIEELRYILKKNLKVSFIADVAIIIRVIHKWFNSVLRNKNILN